MSKVSKKSFLEEIKETAEKVEQKEKLEETIVAEGEESAKAEEDNAKVSLLDRICKKGKVTKEQVEEWKNYYNNKVFATIFDEEEYYVFRYITRPEYKQILSTMPKNSPNAEEVFNDLLVSKCLLYPEYNADLKMTMGAGTADTLSLQIRVASNFIPEAVAIDMINKL